MQGGSENDYESSLHEYLAVVETRRLLRDMGNIMETDVKMMTTSHNAAIIMQTPAAAELLFALLAWQETLRSPTTNEHQLNAFRHLVFTCIGICDQIYHDPDASIVE